MVLFYWATKTNIEKIGQKLLKEANSEQKEEPCPYLALGRMGIVGPWTQTNLSYTSHTNLHRGVNSGQSLICWWVSLITELLFLKLNFLICLPLFQITVKQQRDFKRDLCVLGKKHLKTIEKITVILHPPPTPLPTPHHLEA